VGAAYPTWAPDGKHLLFLGNRSDSLSGEQSIDWWVTSLDDADLTATGALGVTRKEELEGPFLVYPWALLPSAWQPGNGWIVFPARLGDTDNLWRIGLSSHTFKITGTPQRLTSSPVMEDNPSLAILAGGVVRMAFASHAEITDIWSLPLEANSGKVTGAPRQLTRDATADFHPSLSADGRKMVFVSARSGSQQIWIKDLESGSDSILTASRPSKYQPSFSPDSTTVSFAEHEGLRWDIHLAPSAGGASEMICEDCGQATGWSPDGKYIVGNSVAGTLFLVEVASRRRIDLISVRSKGRWFAGGQFSPDGRWMTFLDATRRLEVIAPFEGETPAAESTWITVMAELRQWSPDGAIVYGPSSAGGSDYLWAQRLDRGAKRPIGDPFQMFQSHGARTLYAGAHSSVGRDRIVFTLAERAGSIWMAEWRDR